MLLIYDYGLAGCFGFVACATYYGVGVLVFRFVVMLPTSLLSVCVYCLVVVWLWVDCCLLVVSGGWVLLGVCCLGCVYYALVFWFVSFWFGFCVLGLFVFVGFVVV